MPDYRNDPSIKDDADVWRRINPKWVKHDPAQGRLRPSSQAFQDSTDGTPLSVLLAADLPGPHAALEGHEGYYLAALSVGFVRSLGFVVTRHPIRDQDPPGHAWIVGRKTSRFRTELARHATWVVGP